MDDGQPGRAALTPEDRALMERLWLVDVDDEEWQRAYRIFIQLRDKGLLPRLALPSEFFTCPDIHPRAAELFIERFLVATLLGE